MSGSCHQTASLV